MFRFYHFQGQIGCECCEGCECSDFIIFKDKWVARVANVQTLSFLKINRLQGL